MGAGPVISSLNPQMSALQSRENLMMQDMKSARGPNDDAKIEKSSKDFEAILVGSWLQQAEQSFATVPGADADDKDVGRDQVMSFGVQSLATSLAASGGIGIGKMIAKAMHASANKADAQAGVQSEAAK
jgi:Rod binding domain-containing protein